MYTRCINTYAAGHVKKGEPVLNQRCVYVLELSLKSLTSL